MRYLSPVGSSLEQLESALQDWGLNYPFDDIWPAFQMFVLTEFRVLPTGGGYLDQDPLLMEDFRTLLLLKQWHEIPQPELPKLSNNW